MKTKHLEFIQNIITRMNSNSFLIKGWAITLVSALFALSATSSNLKFIYVAFIAIQSFWVLDGFFIAVERRFRDLYKEVAGKDEDSIDFQMDISKFNKGDRTWFNGVFSSTLVPFYGILIAVCLIVMYLIR